MIAALSPEVAVFAATWLPRPRERAASIAMIRLSGSILGPLARDPAFWNHALDGLAVLVGPGMFRALPQTVAEVVVVGESFHIKPLRRFLQTVDRYQVLALSLDKIRLLEGTRHVLDEIELVSEVRSNSLP